MLEPRRAGRRELLGAEYICWIFNQRAERQVMALGGTELGLNPRGGEHGSVHVYTEDGVRVYFNYLSARWEPYDNPE